ncbi:hypothetical protein FB451DRAFT_1444766 [Mycena latifolia]|nr:hypothetical protein FB451DRAFT_1444766 [Mycena latifolia]
MSFASNVGHLTLGEGVYNNVHGNYIIVHNIFYGRKRHCEEIGDSLSITEPTPKRCRREENSEDGIKIIRNRHLKLIAEIGSGHGYFLHAGETNGRAVLVKVFNPGPTVRENLWHPNVLRIEGVSSPASLTQFIAYETGPLAVALKDDLTRSITLGFKMIAGLSAGINHLIIHGVPLASLGVENFDIFLDVDDRFLVSINPRIPAEAGTTNGEQPENNTNRSWDVFNAICKKVLRSANRLLHDEDIDRNPASMEPTRHPSVLQQISVLPPLQSSEPSSSENLLEGEAPVSPRREYVWRTIDRGQQSLATIGNRIARELDLKLSSVNKFAWTDDRSPHRCAGYVREEITLATTVADSVVVSYDAPSPLKICSVCREIVGVQEEFQCLCGDPKPGWRSTVKCRECKIWSHGTCVGNLKEFTCQSCTTEVQEPLLSRPFDEEDQESVLATDQATWAHSTDYEWNPEGWGPTNVFGEADKLATPIYHPEATYSGPIQYGVEMDLGTGLPDEEKMLTAMQGLKNPAWWDNIMLPGFSWPESPGHSPASTVSNGSQSP